MCSLLIASHTSRSPLLIAIRPPDTNHTAAGAKEKDTPEACEPAVSRGESEEEPNLNSKEQPAEHAQAEFLHQPKLPQVTKDMELSQESKQEQAESPLPPARPLTPPTDDSRQAFGNGLPLDDKLQPPVHFPPLQSSSVGSSSPERDTPSGQPKRVRQIIGSAEMKSLFGPEFESLPLLRSSQGSMPPPRTPLSSLGSSHKPKRKSDAITSPKSQDSNRPVKRNRGSSTSNAGSPGKPFLTRGRFVREVDTSGGNLKGAEAGEPDAHESPAKTPLILRIVIKNQGETIIDRQLVEPLKLSRKVAAPETPKVPSSPVFPLPESVIFSTRKMNDNITPLMKPPQAFQPPTPHASSSPTRKPPKSRSSSPHKKAQTPIGESPSISRHEQKNREEKARTQDRQMAELNELWKMPELSKDSVISFAEEGPWRTSGNGKGGVWRNIRSARPGYFKETEVLFGVRYVIG